MTTRRTKVKRRSLRSPAQLAADSEAHALKRRSVYTQRAIDALSSPLQDLWDLLGDESAARFAAAELQEQGRQIEDCCSTNHAVPILVRVGDSGPESFIGAVVAPHHCGRALCTRCEQREQTHAKSRARLKAALERAMVRGGRPRFITLTIANQPRLAAAVDDLSGAARALRKTPEWAHHIRGGVRALEVTHNDGIRRRLKRDVAEQHGLMCGKGRRVTYIEEVTRKQNADGSWTTATTRRDLDKRDAAKYLDALHDAGADIYRKTPWAERHCTEHGAKGCDECDPRGWHPHHHIVAEGEFWLGLCEVCNLHSRHNCPDCRQANSDRRAAHRAGKTAGAKRGFSRVCGGLQDRDGLTGLKSTGTLQMAGESDAEHKARMRKHKTAFDWMLKTTRGVCETTQLRKQLGNEHRLGAEKGWTERRTKTVERIQRKLDAISEDGDDRAARCLSCSWAAATGGASNVVDVREVTGWRDASSGGPAEAIDGVSGELLKYLTKSAVMTKAAMVEFAWTMRRKRRVAWFGDWQGMVINQGPVDELRCSTRFDVLWDAIHDPDTQRRMYFRGPAALCHAARKGHPGVTLWEAPPPGVGRDLPAGWLAGSIDLSSPLAGALYAAAAARIPEQPAAETYTATNDEGAAPERAAPKPEQLAVPF